MSEVETHLLASTDGYTTKGRSPGISPEEIRELEQLIHGQPDDPAILASMASAPTAMARRFACSGRYAISRILPGRADSAGRQTIAVCSLVMPADSYAVLAAGDLWSVLNASNLWKIDNFSTGRTIRLPDRAAVRRSVSTKDISYYDTWFRARQQPRGLAITPSLPDADRAIVELAQVLSPQERMEYLWGCRLLSAQAPVSIASFVSIDQAHLSRRPVVNITPEVQSDAGRRAMASVGRTQIAMPAPAAAKADFSWHARPIDALDAGQINLEPERAATSRRRLGSPPMQSGSAASSNWWKWGILGLAGFVVVATIAAVSMLSPPGTPQDLKSEADQTNITISWRAPSRASSYRIEYRRDSQQEGEHTEIPGTIQASDPDRREWKLPVQPGQRWFFKVFAISWTARMSEAAETKLVDIPLDQPRELEVIENGGITLKWRPVEGAQHYTVKLVERGAREPLGELRSEKTPSVSLKDWQTMFADRDDRSLSLQVIAESEDGVKSESQLDWNPKPPQGSSPSPDGGKPAPGNGGAQPDSATAKPLEIRNFKSEADPQSMTLKVTWRFDSTDTTNFDVEIRWNHCASWERVEFSPSDAQSFEANVPDRLGRRAQIRFIRSGVISKPPTDIQRELIDGFKVECIKGSLVRLICPGLEKLSQDERAAYRVVVSRSKPDDCSKPGADRVSLPFTKELDLSSELQNANSGVPSAELWLTIVSTRAMSDTVHLDRLPCPDSSAPSPTEEPLPASDEPLTEDMKKAVNVFLGQLKDLKRNEIPKLDSKLFAPAVTKWLDTFKWERPSTAECQDQLKRRLTSLAQFVKKRASEATSNSFDATAPSFEQFRIASIVASLPGTLEKAVKAMKVCNEVKDEGTLEKLCSAVREATHVTDQWLISKFENDLIEASKEKSQGEWISELEALRSSRTDAERKFFKDVLSWSQKGKQWEKKREGEVPTFPNPPVENDSELLQLHAKALGALLKNSGTTAPDNDPQQGQSKVSSDLEFWATQWEDYFQDQRPSSWKRQKRDRVREDTIKTLRMLVEYANQRRPKLAEPPA